MIAEALTRPVGFVLGGGESLGASQVGMLQALAEHRIVADVVVGSSVGSLNGAIVAIDPAGAASRLSHAWAGMTREMVFPGGLLAQARTLQRTRTHLFPSSGLAAVITGFLGAATSFAELAVPFGAVVLDCTFPGHLPPVPPTTCLPS
jgi:NTE family protein